MLNEVWRNAEPIVNGDREQILFWGQIHSLAYYFDILYSNFTAIFIFWFEKTLKVYLNIHLSRNKFKEHLLKLI